MPRIGAVEGFVAQRKVGDDVALDDCFEQRPLEPGRVAQPAMRDAAGSIEAHPAEDIAAECFDKRISLPSEDRQWRVKRTGGKAVENLVQQAEALLDLADADPDAGVDVALGKNR